MQKLFSDDSLLPIIQQNIQQNCYFSHPENVLTMIGDDNKTIRAKAVSIISEIKCNNKEKPKIILPFENFIFPDTISMRSQKKNQIFIILAVLRRSV